MSRYPKYVSVADRKIKNNKKIEKLKKKDKNLSPVVIAGRNIAKTWWGKAWVDNLEIYADYSNRLSRGRSYVKYGSVADLKIKSGDIKALVIGSGSSMYKINIAIKPIEESVVANLEGKLSSLEELIKGKFPKELEEMFKSKDDGLFPNTDEITFSCTCPDSAIMCKHVVAVLYGVGAKLDEDPKLFFELRNIKIEELINETIQKNSDDLIKKSELKSDRIIEQEDVLDLFDL